MTVEIVKTVEKAILVVSVVLMVARDAVQTSQVECLGEIY